MHHRRLGLITLLIFLLGIFLFYFFGWASFLETKEAHKKWQDANKEKENMVELVGLTPQLSVQFQKFTESVVPLLQATPRSLQASDYISLLSSLARQSGNVLTRVKVAKPDTSGDVAIEIGFAGTLTTLEKMLQKIERTLPLLEVADTTPVAELSQLNFF